MASKLMASKFMANAAFEARLLLRPSHQRDVWTVNKLECPIPGRPTLPPILSSRSDSDSTSTPPLPKPPDLLRARSVLGLRIRHTQTLLSLLPFHNSPGLL